MPAVERDSSLGSSSSLGAPPKPRRGLSEGPGGLSSRSPAEQGAKAKPATSFLATVLAKSKHFGATPAAAKAN